MGIVLKNQINFSMTLIFYKALQGHIFDKGSKKVLGLLNVEYRNSEDKKDGRGPMNGAIKMSSILKHLEEQKPNIYDKIQSKEKEETSFNEEDILIKGVYRYPDFGDNYIFTLKVKWREPP